MLGAMFRVWARQAGKQVSAWMATLDRKLLAFGPGKTAEAAAYSVALEMEITDGEVEDWAVTIISDLEKGFEKGFEKGVEEKTGRSKKNLQVK